MYYFIYETTNLINGKKYRGYHTTNNVDDSYFGSGNAIKKALDKYGKENFKREILEMCNSAEEVIEREKFYVDDEWFKRRDTYNLQKGGRFPRLTEEAKAKIGKTVSEKYNNGEIKVFGIKKGEKKVPWNKGIKTGSNPNRKSRKGIKTNKPAWNKGLPAWNAGLKLKPMSEEHKEKITEAWEKKMLDGYTGHNKGKKLVQNYKGRVAMNKGIPAKKYVCEHCKREIGGKSNYDRWHGDNCKNKNIQ